MLKFPFCSGQAYDAANADAQNRNTRICSGNQDISMLDNYGIKINDVVMDMQIDYQQGWHHQLPLWQSVFSGQQLRTIADAIDDSSKIPSKGITGANQRLAMLNDVKQGLTTVQRCSVCLCQHWSASLMNSMTTSGS